MRAEGSIFVNFFKKETKIPHRACRFCGKNDDFLRHTAKVTDKFLLRKTDNEF